MNKFPQVRPQPYLMVNQVQHYEWGTRNDASYIPKLIGITPEPDLPYAELWMGAHTKAPSRIIVDGVEVPLDQWVTAYPTEILGEVVAHRFANTFPFLFKVLAAGEALSIQAHPSKDQARILHAKDPAHYPDDNHKPEVAIALDALTALMGIKPFDQLIETLTRYPEVAGFIGIELRPLVALVTAKASPALGVQALLTALFTRSTSHAVELKSAIDALAQRLSTSGVQLDEVEQLFLDLHEKYTGPDVGLFCIFLLNLIHLQKGEGMYAEAGIPHAYLKGNVVECMANSDNVVRVGLTPKFKDSPALLQILQYEPQPISILGSSTNDAKVVYPTPAPEFRVTRVRLQPDEKRLEITGGKPQILIIIKGQLIVENTGGQANYAQGQSIFVPAILSDYTLHATDDTEYFMADIPI
jgi:mannose-6-phosphate isomerase